MTNIKDYTAKEIIEKFLKENYKIEYEWNGTAISYGADGFLQDRPGVGGYKSISIIINDWIMKFIYPNKVVILSKNGVTIKTIEISEKEIEIIIKPLISKYNKENVKIKEEFKEDNNIEKEIIKFQEFIQN